jgi:hypothetical protein
MKLDAARFGIAAAAAAAVLWLALALFVMLLPGATMGGAGAMHGMGWGMAAFGLIVWSALAGAMAWLTASFYNRWL